ncbi:MAG: beta-galactosidase [Verrucomicrobiota bacterium]
MTSRALPKATCRISRHALSLGGKDTFIYSGEVHYFRIPTRYWDKHLQALADAGCNAVSTYVPWSWHEFEEGRFDITGRTHSERDIVGFVDRARAHNLFVTLKPGPYVMAETTDQGIPQWLTRDYPDTLALDEQGRPWGPQFVTYTSETFREKSARWLQLFAKKVVVPRQNLKRGAVIMMQLCNEIGMFQWLGARGDYSPANLAAWHHYLKKHYPDIKELARLLDREIHHHAEVMPPHELCDTRREFVLYRLWHDFHRWLYGDYVKCLATMLREAGVAVPLFTNVGGWVFGRAHEFALNGTFHRESAKVEPDVLYGLDHIPEFVSPLNVHDGIVANQTAAELQRGRGPLYSAELQCGSREHGVQTYPGELGLFYRLCIIHGLTAMNFYMFSQGRNPKGRGTDGPMFYWYNAVDYQARRQPTYPMIRELGEWLKINGDFLVNAQRPASLAVGFYPYLYETEFLVPILGKGTKMNPGKLGLTMDPVDFRNRAYFDGVLKILTKKSVPYDLADLTVRSVKDLLKYDELVVMPNELMDAATQTKLVQYVRAGGKLVIFPRLPIYDLEFTPCHILEKAFGYEVRHSGKSNRIYMGDLKDIPVPTLPWVMRDHGGRVLARDVNGEVVGIEKKVGKGTVRFFGFFVYYGIEEHPDLWSAMMELPEIERNAWADSDDLHVEARFSGGEGVLFVGNFHRMPVSASIKVRNPGGREPIDIGRLNMPSLTGLFLPVQAKVAPGLTLAFAHGELLERTALRRGGARFALRGPENMKGVLALRSQKAIKSVTVDGQPATWQADGRLVRVEYVQTGCKQVIEVR